MSVIPRMLRRPPLISARPTRKARLGLEMLEGRDVPSAAAVFNAGVLSVVGDAADNNIAVSAAPDGSLQVTNNGAAVAIQVTAGAPSLAQTTLVKVDGGAGNDTITLNRSLNMLDANGKLLWTPQSSLQGGDGNDTLTVLNGGFQGGVVGNPVLGNSVMDGGAGNDTLNSGFGNDIMRGGQGDDNYVWAPGTLTDVWDGNGGNDTVTIIGNAAQNDAFLLRAKPDGSGRVQFDRTNLVPFTVDIGSTENIVLRPDANGNNDTGNDSVIIGSLQGVANLQTVTVYGGGGNDVIDGSAQDNAAISLTLNGGPGDDILRGGAGNDILSGGAGNDDLDGGRGADQLNGGDGNDILKGGPQGYSDGSVDLLTGGPGADRFVSPYNPNTFATEDWLVDFNPAEGDKAFDPNGVPIPMFPPVNSGDPPVNLGGQPVNSGGLIIVT